MAIGYDDIRDSELWIGVAHHWYSKASVEAPITGRLHHHLAISAKPKPKGDMAYLFSEREQCRPRGRSCFVLRDVDEEDILSVMSDEFVMVVKLKKVFQ